MSFWTGLDPRSSKVHGRVESPAMAQPGRGNQIGGVLEGYGPS